MFKKIGIIGAMEVEVTSLIEKLENKTNKTVGKTTYYSGTLNNKDVVICKCGIGKVNSAIATQIMISEFKVDSVINTGVAGALSNDLDICDLVISSDLFQHDFDTSFVGDKKGVVCGFDVETFPADNSLISALEKACDNILKDNKHFTGRIATGDQFIGSRDVKNTIRDDFDAMCVEMEGGSIAQTCYVNNIPFVVLRSISDKADDSAELSYMTFVEKAAVVSSNIVVEFLKNI